jgi:hypothetical protein
MGGCLAVKNEEAALVADLFADYDSDIKPTLKRSDQIVVTLSFILSKIGGLVSCLCFRTRLCKNVC